MSDTPDMGPWQDPGVLIWEYGSDHEVLGELRLQRSGWRPANLRKPGFAPRTLVDVGAEHGTPFLYKAFPDAYRVLIEPLRECGESLKQWTTAQSGEHITTAVGDAEGEARMLVYPDRHWASSLLPTVSSPDGSSAEHRQVPITTLDRLLEERGWEPPFALKIDTEGFEDRVIGGATGLLQQTQFVIAEVSVAKRFEDSYSFAGFIALMDTCGFQLTDVLDGAKTGRKGTVVFLDLLFSQRS